MRSSRSLGGLDRAAVPSVMDGGRAVVILVEPLHGGSPEGRVIGVSKLQGGCEGTPISGVNLEKVPPQGFFENYTSTATIHFTPSDGGLRC